MNLKEATTPVISAVRYVDGIEFPQEDYARGDEAEGWTTEGLAEAFEIPLEAYDVREISGPDYAGFFYRLEASEDYCPVSENECRMRFKMDHLHEVKEYLIIKKK